MDEGVESDYTPEKAIPRRRGPMSGEQASAPAEISPLSPQALIELERAGFKPQQTEMVTRMITDLFEGAIAQRENLPAVAEALEAVSNRLQRTSSGKVKPVSNATSLLQGAQTTLLKRNGCPNPSL